MEAKSEYDTYFFFDWINTYNAKTSLAKQVDLFGY